MPPPVPVRGLVDIIDKVEKAYLVCAPGNTLSNAALTEEHINAMHTYDTEQAYIASILVDLSLGINLPPPGISFIPALPTVHVEVRQGTRRGDPQCQVQACSHAC